MVKIEMYTKTYCPYCTKAKMLLEVKGFKDILEYNIGKDSSLLREFSSRTNGAKTVPQIFINDVLVGGFDDLNALDKKNLLNDMLGIK